MSWIIDNIAPIMFLSMILFLLTGFPVAFALGATGLAFAGLGIYLNLLTPALLQALPMRIFGIMENDILLAIPYFTFMGLILERSGMAEDLLDSIGKLFGNIRGGLAYAVIFVGALLAATTGVVAASVISMGLISLPLMLRHGYDRRIASGVIAASGTLAQIIPPSLILIIMADQLGKSVGDMYKGAFVPGLILTLLYVAFIFLVSIIKPHYVPALPKDAMQTSCTHSWRNLGIMTGIATLLAYGFIQTELKHLDFDQKIVIGMALSCTLAWLMSFLDQICSPKIFSRYLFCDFSKKIIQVLIPPLALIFLVLGTIFLGIATPTEGGGMGVIGALLLALSKKRLNIVLLRQALMETLKLSSFVIFILIGARVFSLIFYGVKGHIWVEHLLSDLPGGQIGFLLFINALFFVLAFFLDFFELAFILVPLVAPVAEKMGIDLIWLGVLLGVNLQTSFMHPPFGFALFYLRSVAPSEPYEDKVNKKILDGVSTSQIYWGAIPFVVIQCVMVLILIVFPGLVSYDKASPQQAPALEDIQLEPNKVPSNNHPDGQAMPGIQFE